MRSFLSLKRQNATTHSPVLRYTYALPELGESRFNVGLSPDGQAVAIEIQLGRPKRVSGANAVIRVDERTETLLFIRHDARMQYRKYSHQIAAHRIDLVPHPAESKLIGVLPLSALRDLPPTVGNNHAEIKWHLDLHIPLSGSPDVRETVPLDAGPGGEPFPVPGISN